MDTRFEHLRLVAVTSTGTAARVTKTLSGTYDEGEDEDARM